MTTQTEAERMADALQAEFPGYEVSDVAAAELRRLVSFNQQLMDEVARLNKAVADEREACAKVCDDWPNGRDDVYSIGVAIRARGNT